MCSLLYGLKSLTFGCSTQVSETVKLVYVTN